MKNSAFFANSTVYCLRKAIDPSITHPVTVIMWLSWAQNDLRMCIREARKEGKIVEPELFEPDFDYSGGA